MNKTDGKWIVAALVVPQMVYFLLYFIISLIWEGWRDVPYLFDLLPIAIAWIVMAYCLMAVNINNMYIRLTTATIIVLLTMSAGLLNQIFVSCSIWRDCP